MNTWAKCKWRRIEQEQVARKQKMLSKYLIQNVWASTICYKRKHTTMEFVYTKYAPLQNLHPLKNILFLEKSNLLWSKI